jgi:excisionase family DNA binding protein
MKMHTITVELDARDITADHADQLVTSLEQLHPAVGNSPRGWLEVTITIPAEHVGQAVTLAIAAIEQAAGHPTIAVTAMTEEEADAREGWESLPDLVSVSEAAELLGVSRQAVLDRINRHTLPASKIGRDYAIPRAALTKAPASMAEKIADVRAAAEQHPRGRFQQFADATKEAARGERR